MEKQAPNAILEAMRLGTEYRHSIRVRGLQVLVRPLSIAEKRMVASLVVDEMEKLPTSARNAMTEQTLYAEIELSYATTSKPDAQDFKLPRDTLKLMTVEELLALFKQYNGVCDKVNPMFEDLDRATVEKLVVDLKKNPTELTKLSLMEMASVCRLLLESSPEDRSSGS